MFFFPSSGIVFWKETVLVCSLIAWFILKDNDLKTHLLFNKVANSPTTNPLAFQPLRHGSVSFPRQSHLGQSLLVPYYRGDPCAVSGYRADMLNLLLSASQVCVLSLGVCSKQKSCHLQPFLDNELEITEGLKTQAQAELELLREII